MKYMSLEPDLWDLKLPEIVQQFTQSLNREILPSDGMFQNDRRHYFSCGASALACILHAIGMSGITKPNSVLDFGCGAGRVTRWLCAAFPEALIQACDVREDDLVFVKQSLGVSTWVSGIDIAALKPPIPYDVIWVGSVFTHLSAKTSSNLFTKLMGWLNPNGVLIFSVHGRYVLHRANSGDNIYGLGKLWETLVQDYVRNAYGYADYPQEYGLGPGYGISVSKSTWWINLVERCGNMRLACLTERAWDHHHDVIAVQNSKWD
jgi:SAM-dependent methyltransferase